MTAPRREGSSDWRFVLLAFAVSRSFVLAAFAFAAARLHAPFSVAALERAFVQWDATWLLQIAAHGYREAHEHAFFPAFPFLVRGLTALGLQPVLAAVAVNHLLLLVACMLLFRISVPLVGRRAARGAVLVLLLHPLSFYFSVPYSEALFLAASLAAIAAARGGHAWAAGLAGALAVLTRNTGIFLLPALAWMLRATPRRLPWLLPLPAALGFWMLHGARTQGDPLLFVHAQAHWDMFLTWPRALWRDLGRYRAWMDHHLPFSLLGVVLAVRVARKLPAPYILYVAGPIVLSFCLPKLAITPRLHLVLFPLWIVAAQGLTVRPRRVAYVLLALASLSMQWHFVGRYVATLWVD